ncbi:Six-hairpin glycosidase-like protein [Colletotrichum navitas]|uniref:Six-hairpin glycosidase-like protein n=1 Tax=Colletotrichum navitas TaxID=681940 RepID=A0AAD8PIQ8_9PEZI|nr:Six-hairpin glycosidase-like protein [Colletotrichum navitas]KAK1561563.1 Six-hairpin glycosidase-like protein [Colletotrichum navitas]
MELFKHIARSFLLISGVAGALSTLAVEGAFVFGTDGIVNLSSDGVTPDIQIVDFGQNFEGHPTFEVISTSGDTSVFEVSFAESKAAFGGYQSDGPLGLAAAMDTYRVRRYNISESFIYEGRLIQGSFRYQKLNLSSSGELVLKNVGVRQTVNTTPIDELPGSFQCSDEDLTRIWRTGARTVQLTEIPKDTIPDFWDVSEKGSFVDSLAPQPLAGIGSGGLMTYKLAFEVLPASGAFMFAVLQDTLGNGIDITCDLNAGTLQAEVESTMLASANLSIPWSRDAWLSVKASVSSAGIKVAINNASMLEFNQTSKFFGSFGLGTPFAHSAYFRNLEVTDLLGGPIYSSSLTDRDFLDDFLMGSNPADTIVDGSRRDRISYAGDLDIALAASFASTYGLSFVEGSLNLLGSFQLEPGFFVPTAKIQQKPMTGLIPANQTGLIAYSFNLISAFSQTYMITGNVTFAQTWAPAVMRMLDWAESKLVNGVFTLDEPTFTGDWNYYDPPQNGASSKFNAVYAYALQQSLHLLTGADMNATKYEVRLTNLRQAMHSQLFDASLGFYKLSSEITSGFAQDAQAIAILAGVPQANNISAIDLLSRMGRELLLVAGPLAFSNSTVSAGFAQKISPYASSYHLRAALETGHSDAALALLKTLWAPLADPQHANYTNCFWETLEPDGNPGLGISTSLCHGWGAGPTGELTRFVLGIQPAAPGFSEWVVKPLTLGLKWAVGRQRTERGDINVEWRFDDAGLLQMNVTGPEGGKIHLPQPLLVPMNESIITVNGEIVTGVEFPFAASKTTTIVQMGRPLNTLR